MDDLTSRDSPHFAALFALMYDHFIERDPLAAHFKWVEARANLARFDSLLSREDAQRALADGIEALELEAAFVLLYEGCARYRGADYAFTPEDWHHLYRTRLRCALSATEAVAAIDAGDEGTERAESVMERAFA